MFPLEFVIAGTPLSLQASPQSLARWKRIIGDAANNRLREGDGIVWIDDRPLAVTILCFFAEPMTGDIDNVVKPILDGMTGVVYRDDRVVERVLIQRFEPGYDWSISPGSNAMLRALADPPPIVYVRVDDDLGWRQFE